MSNLIAFNSVFERAMRVESNRESFNESLTVNVPTPVILFAKSHIDRLEEQLLADKKEIGRLRDLLWEETSKKPQTQGRDSSFGIA